MKKEITGWEERIEKVVEEGFKQGHIGIPLGSKWLRESLSNIIDSAVEAERARIKQEVQTIIDTKGYESGDVVLGVIKFLESI